MVKRKVNLPQNVKIYATKYTPKSKGCKWYLVYEEVSYYWLPNVDDLRDTEKQLKTIIKRFPNGKSVGRHASAFVSKGNTLGFGIEFQCEYETMKEFKSAGYEINTWY